MRVQWHGHAARGRTRSDWLLLVKRTPAFDQGNAGGQGAGDTTRNLVLKLENIRKLALESIAPDYSAIVRLGQLRCYAHALARAPHASTHEIVCAKLGTDLFLCRRLLLVPQDRVTTDDVQGIKSAERIDDLLRHSVGEVVLRLVPGLIGEG